MLTTVGELEKHADGAPAHEHRLIINMHIIFTIIPVKSDFCQLDELKKFGNSVDLANVNEILCC